MGVKAVDYNILSNELLTGIDYNNYTDFHSFKLILKKYNKDISNKRINEILEFLKNDLAIYCDGDMTDITEEEFQLLKNVIDN